MVAVAVVVVAVAVLEAAQLAGELAGHQIDAGVEVLAALLGPDHGAVGEHRDFDDLLRHPRVAGDRQMHVGLLHHVLEVIDRPAEFGFGVVPDRGGDIEIAAVDEQFHRISCDVISWRSPILWGDGLGGGSASGGTSSRLKVIAFRWRQSVVSG